MKLRYEKKYLVRNTQLDALRNRFLPFLDPDVFAGSVKQSHPEYTVRSIYLDTPDMESLHEKADGLEMRKKLRIRGYDSPNPDTEVFLEIKRKIGNRIGKNRALVPYSKLPHLLEWGLDEALISELDRRKMKDNAIRFLYQKNKNLQQPINLIVYDREPYHGKFDPSVRITFDKNIRSKFKPDFGELFTDFNLKNVWPQHFILEIKYNEQPMPIWAKSIVEEFKLTTEALSKYVEGYYCHSLTHI